MGSEEAVHLFVSQVWEIQAINWKESVIQTKNLYSKKGLKKEKGITVVQSTFMTGLTEVAYEEEEFTSLFLGPSWFNLAL